MKGLNPFHTIKRCLIHVDGKKYTKNEIKIGDKLMFIHYSKPEEYSGNVMVDMKKPSEQVDIKEYNGNDFILRFTWSGPWTNEDTGLESTKTLDFKVKFERRIDGERVYLGLIGKYKIKNKSRKTHRRKVDNTKKKSKGRKGPSESATKFKVGKIKKGNDGNMWKIVVNKKGVQRWQKINK